MSTESSLQSGVAMRLTGVSERRLWDRLSVADSAKSWVVLMGDRLFFLEVAWGVLGRGGSFMFLVAVGATGFGDSSGLRPRIGCFGCLER